MRCYGDKPPAYTAKVKGQASFPVSLHVQLSVMLCGILKQCCASSIFWHAMMFWCYITSRSCSADAQERPTTVALLQVTQELQEQLQVHTDLTL